MNCNKKDVCVTGGSDQVVHCELVFLKQKTIKCHHFQELSTIWSQNTKIWNCAVMFCKHRQLVERQRESHCHWGFERRKLPMLVLWEDFLQC